MLIPVPVPALSTFSAMFLSSVSKMMDRSSSQYDSFLFWRQPIPELDLSELEDLGLVEEPARSAAGRDDCCQEEEVSQGRDIFSHVGRPELARSRQSGSGRTGLTRLSPPLSAGLPVPVYFLHLLASSSRRRGLSAGWSQPAAVKPPHITS